MTRIGRYLKAYPVERLRQFPPWAELAKEPPDQPYLYVQENYTVTEGIFLDEAIVFDQVTPEWIAFCENNLAFSMPEWAVTANQETSS
jgi:hypothetical protein